MCSVVLWCVVMYHHVCAHHHHHMHSIAIIIPPWISHTIMLQGYGYRVGMVKSVILFLLLCEWWCVVMYHHVCAHHHHGSITILNTHVYISIIQPCVHSNINIVQSRGGSTIVHV